jgi:hypothetical protein
VAQWEAIKDTDVINHSVAGTGLADRRTLLGALARADAERTRLRLDLSALDEGNPSKRRLNGWWIAAMSNLLLGRYGALPVAVVLPRSNSIQVQLLRGAFYFSLAQRKGSVDYADQTDRSRQLLESSRGDWAPRNGPVLFPVADGARLEDRTYLYANTHVRAEPGYYRRYEASAAFPWLGDVVPRASTSQGDFVRQSFLSAICDTFAEVMDNTSTHAFNLRDASFAAGWLGPTVVETARSCLMVSLTTGGQGSHDRLHFLALDNGFGVPRTLRWQHPRPLRHDASGQLMMRVLQRRLSNREITGHNGAGLWFLHGLARFAGGTLTLIAEDDLSDGRAAARVTAKVPSVESGLVSTWDADVVDAPIRGTLVHLQMKVPTLNGLDPAQLTEKLEEFRRYRADWPAMA